MDVIAQGLSRPARRMDDDAFSAARAGCHSAPYGFVLQRRVRPQFSPSCWYRPRACLFERWARLVPTQRVLSARPHNLHWQVRIRRICEVVSRAGGTPVVVAGVRSPFGYYVSHYFYALHAQQQHRDPPHRRLGAAWFSSKQACCLLAKKTARLSRAAP